MGINGNLSEGYLEALDKNGHRGGVCETNFDKFAGQVICQMLGYPIVILVNNKDHSYDGNFVLELKRRPGPEEPSCTGEEFSIFDCNLSEEFPICSSGKVAYVKCMEDDKDVCKKGDTLDDVKNSDDFCFVTVC